MWNDDTEYQAISDSHEFAFFDYEDYEAEARKGVDYVVKATKGYFMDLFRWAEITPDKLEFWFDCLMEFEHYEDTVKVYYMLVERKYTFEDAMWKFRRTTIFKGDLTEYAKNWVEDTRALDCLPAYLRPHFDYEALGEAFGRDGWDQYEHDDGPYVIDYNSC